MSTKVAPQSSLETKNNTATTKPRTSQRQDVEQGTRDSYKHNDDDKDSDGEVGSRKEIPALQDVRMRSVKQLDPAVQRHQESEAKKNGLHRPYVQTRDKIMFCISVGNLFLLSLFIGGYQWLLPYYYTLLAGPFLFLRFWTYGRDRYAYFLLDLCYWGNFLLLLFLWLPAYEYSDYFFATVYALATGPMGWAVIIFRNSMVFHSLDKSISNFIHLGPIIVVFALRWHSPVAENMSNETMDSAGHVRDVYPYDWAGFGRFKICEVDQPCFTDWWLWFFLIPIAAQLVWVFFYALATRACCKMKDHHVDAFRYLTSKGALLQVLGKWKNQNLAYFVYNVVNYLANVGMTFPAALFYLNYYANLGFIVLLLGASIWNGANFYIDVFSKKYQLQVKQVVEKDERTLQLKRSRKSPLLAPVDETSSGDSKWSPPKALTEEGKVVVV